MKTLKLRATLLLLSTLTLGLSATIDEQITAIQEAAPEDRVTLVNEFKQTLSTMTTDDRTVAIEQFKTTMQSDGQQIKTQTQTKERIRVNEMAQTKTQQMQQNMNQHQTGSQAVGAARQSGVPVSSGGGNKFMGHR